MQQQQQRNQGVHTPAGGGHWLVWFMFVDDCLLVSHLRGPSASSLLSLWPENKLWKMFCFFEHQHQVNEREHSILSILWNNRDYRV